MYGYLIDYAYYQSGRWSSLLYVSLTHLNSIHQRHFIHHNAFASNKISDKIKYAVNTYSYWWNKLIILVRKFLSYKAVSYEARCIEYFNTSTTFKGDHFLYFYKKDDEAVYANCTRIKINARKLLRWGKTNSVQQKRQNVDWYILVINHEYVILLIVWRKCIFLKYTFEYFELICDCSI